MTDQTSPVDDSVYTFAWHPTYGGRSVDAVRAELAATIASDQRAYALALEAAEQHESSALESVIGLERRWSPFDLNWAESNPNSLADHVVRFEWERERRQSVIPISVYRDELRQDDDADHRDPVSSQRLESNPIRGIVVASVLVIAIVVWWLFLR